MFRKISIKDLRALYSLGDTAARQMKKHILVSIGKSGTVLTLRDLAFYEKCDEGCIVDFLEHGFSHFKP